MLINFVKNTSLLLILVGTLLRTQNEINYAKTAFCSISRSLCKRIETVFNHNDRHNKPCKLRTQDWKVLGTKTRFLRMFPHRIYFWTFLRDMTAFPLFAINNFQQIKASFLGKHYSFFHGPRIVFTSQTRLWASY